MIKTDHEKDILFEYYIVFIDCVEITSITLSTALIVERIKERNSGENNRTEVCASGHRVKQLTYQVQSFNWESTF